VFRNIDQQFIDFTLDGNSVVEHNTLIGGALICGHTHQGNVCNETIMNNIVSSVNLSNGDGSGSPKVNDYNLCTGGGCAGSHSLKGNPTYVGGSNSSSYVGYALTGMSLGHGSASDSTDIGININAASTNQPAAPTGLIVTVQ
jgi:hypothetical protein